VTFELGDLVPLGLEVRDANLALVSASAISCTITLPDGSTLTPTPTSPSTGRYIVDYVPTMIGRHSVRWVTTGPNTGYSDTFDVEAGDLGSLISLDDAKRAIGMPLARTEDDEELRRMLATASAKVEGRCGAVVRRTVVEDHYLPFRVGNWVRQIQLRQTPILSLTSVTGTMLSSGGYLATDLVIGYQSGTIRLVGDMAFPHGTLTFTYVAGRATVPEPLQTATGIILEHLWQERRGWVAAPTVRGEAAQDRGRPAPWDVPAQAEALMSDYVQIAVG
jgi:hypothetical protein